IAIPVIIMIFAAAVLRLFIKEPEAVESGAPYLRIVALCFPFLGINLVLNRIVRASREMFQLLVLHIISFWVLIVPLADIFSSCFGSVGIGMGMGSSFILSSAFAYGYYRFGKWDKKVLFND